MFRKIVSNLPFSPALVGQLAFYARRLKREEATRKFGLIFVVLTIAVQSLAVFSPPEPALASYKSAEQIATESSIKRSKEARNLSQESEGTSGPAHAGDRIEYTLKTTNIGDEKTTVSIDENLSDVLEYGSLFETGGGTFNDTTQTLRWENITLEPGQVDTRRLVVILFDTIPSTPTATNNPASYDCVLTNTYGNSVNLEVACPTSKLVEGTIQQLPQTGPGANMLFASALLALATYFYLRSRQLRKEVQLLRKEFNGGTM